jgi:hypothetical protein
LRESPTFQRNILPASLGCRANPESKPAEHVRLFNPEDAGSIVLQNTVLFPNYISLWDLKGSVSGV